MLDQVQIDLPKLCKDHGVELRVDDVVKAAFDQDSVTVSVNGETRIGPLSWTTVKASYGLNIQAAAPPEIVEDCTDFQASSLP